MHGFIVAGDRDCWKSGCSGLCVLPSLIPGLPRVSGPFCAPKQFRKYRDKHKEYTSLILDGILIIGFCILLRVLLTVNNTFFFATIDKVFYYVVSVLTTCFGPYIRPSSSEFTKYLKKKILFTVSLDEMFKELVSNIWN
jgi:hypothetical protein